MVITTMQHISEERLALFAEHERLCNIPTPSNPDKARELSDRRQEVWRKLVRLPAKCDAKSTFITDEHGVITEQVIDITWRE
jgi:hypothetical protein